MAEWVGFEPTDPKGQQISSLPRYDRFDTTPYISTAALPGKSERTTGENKIFNSSPQALSSLVPSGFSLGSLPRWTHDFECCTFDHSDNSPYKILPEISSKNRQEIGEINRRDKGEMKHHCFGENLGKSRVCGSGGSIMEIRFRDG